MVFVPIRKLSNESNEEMLAKEHARGRQVLRVRTDLAFKIKMAPIYDQAGWFWTYNLTQR